MSTLLVEQGLQ